MIVMVLIEKAIYTLAELFDNLPVSLRELARISELNEVTIAYIRDGSRATQRNTANKLLNGLSQVYGRPFNLGNVTGFNLERKAAWNKGKPRTSWANKDIQETPTDEITQAEDRK